MRFPPAPVAEPDPRDFVVVPMEYFVEDEDYTAPMFRSAAEEVTSTYSTYIVPRLGGFEIQVRPNQDRSHFLALYLVLRTNFGLFNGIFC